MLLEEDEPAKSRDGTRIRENRMPTVKPGWKKFFQNREGPEAYVSGPFFLKSAGEIRKINGCNE